MASGTLRLNSVRTTLLISTLLCGSAALAQAAPPSTSGSNSLAQEQAPQNRAAAAAPTGSGEIVITGSRLLRQDLTAPSPVTVVGQQDIKASGNVTLEKTLNEFPQLGQGNTSAVNNGGGSGVLTANLRGLGSTRTLTLVNGRRFIPADSAGDVDLASIPDTLIQRVDIITGGASAVYGSDAIAGAVNFVMKDNFQGLEVSGLYGLSDRGDGAQRKVDVTLGGNFDDHRGNVAASVSYTKEDSFTQANRAFSRTPLADNSSHTALVYSGSGNIPGTRVPLSASQLRTVKDVVPTSDTTCTTVTGIRFAAGGVPTQYCQPEDSYNYAGYNLLQRPLSRINVGAIGHYDVADHVTAFGEVYFVDSKNNYVLAPDSFTPVTPGAAAQTLLVPYVNNPVLPAVTAQFFQDNKAIFDPKNTGIASVTGGGRRADELGTRQSYFERQGLDVTGGFRGNFHVIGEDFRWEIFGQYMRDREDTSNINFVNQARLSLALDAVTNSAGQVVCRTQTEGCVPTNVLGLQSISPASAAYLTPERNSYNVFSRKVAGASLSGSLFELPAGPVAVAVGTEYRSDHFASHVSPFDLSGDYGAASSKPLSGGFNVKELFGEVGVPLLKNLPFVYRLSAEGAIRYSDYSSVGGVLAYKAGGEYAPTSWFRFRGAYNRAVRAPNVGELYSAVTQGFTSGLDPCDINNKPTVAQQALCVQQGISQQDISSFHQSTLGLTVSSGGNPNLKAEKSNSFTIGAVVSPPFVRRLNLTVDYYKVDVKGAITSVNVQQTLNDCFANLNPNSPTCQAVHRLPGSGQIDYVSTQSQNIGSLSVAGLDSQLDYRFFLPQALSINGARPELSIAAVASWMFHKTTQTLTSSAPQNCAGYYGAGCSSGSGGFILPKFKLNLNATARSGPVSLRLVGRMIGPLNVYPGVAAFVSHVPAVWYEDASLSLDVGKHVNLMIGVDNIADKQPPILGTTFVGDANVDVSLYDVEGRRYFVGATVKF